MRRLRLPSARLVLAAAILCLAAPARSATQIGVTSAVAPAARGTPADAQSRVLQVGLDMQASERVQTDADGKAHLLFLDGSALSIGPNSDVVLDEYVYVPAAKTGKIALSATKGVFRLVGGAISKTNPVTLRTPQATIGVRGGIATISVGEQGVDASFLYGRELFVESGGRTERVERPGFSIATGPDGAPQPPRPLNQQTVDQQNAAFEGGGARDPGAPPVSDDDIAQSQVSALNSTVAAADVAPAAAGGNGTPPPPSSEDETADASREQMRQATIQPGSPPPPDSAPSPEPGVTEPEPPAAEPPPPVLVLPPPAALPTFSGRAKQGSPPFIGTQDGIPSENIALSNGVVAFDVQSGGQVFTAETGGLPFSINVGAGSFAATATSHPFGPNVLAGNGFLTPEQDFLLFTLVDQSIGRRVLAFAGIPTPAASVPATGIWRYFLQDDFVRGTTLPFIGDPSGGLVSLPPAYIAWDDSQPGGVRAFGAGAISIVGQGASQQSAATVLTGLVSDDGNGLPFLLGRMNGQHRTGASGASNPTALYYSDFSTSDAGDGSDFFGATGPRNFVLESSRVDLTDTVQSRGGQFFLDAGNNFATSYFGNVPAISGQPFAAGQRTTRNLNGFANGLETLYDSGGAFVGTQRLGNFNAGDPTDLLITTDAGQNRVHAVFQLASGADGAVLAQLGATSLGAEAFIDDRTFYALTNGTVDVGSGPSTNVSGLLAMVTSSALQHDGLLPGGVSFCECDYLTWGFFFGRRENLSAQNRVLELGTWVAGEMSNINQLIGFTPASASYFGHVIAGVNNNGSIYTAVGSIALQFGIGGGAFDLQSVTISNFDGMTITGNFAGGFTSNAYSTNLNGPGVVGSLHGAFFGPGTPPINTGGSIDLQGTIYRAHGTFAAELPPS